MFEELKKLKERLEVVKEVVSYPYFDALFVRVELLKISAYLNCLTDNQYCATLGRVEQGLHHNFVHGFEYAIEYLEGLFSIANDYLKEKELREELASRYNPTVA